MLEVTADLALNQIKKNQIDSMEAFLQRKNLKTAQIIDGQIQQITEKELSGIALRTIIGQKMSFATTSVSKSIEELVELSAQNARKSYQYTSRNFVNNKKLTPVEGIVDNRLRDLSLEEITDNLITILGEIKDHPSVRKVDGFVHVETEERLVVNTEGLWKKEIGTRMNGQILTTSRQDDFIGVAPARVTSRLLQRDWQDLLNRSITTALAQKGRQKLSSMKKPKMFILSSAAFANLVAFTLIPAFYLSSVYKNQAPIRKCRFHRNLEMIDDPTVPEGQNTFGFDDEGYPSRPRVLLSGGRCKRFLGMNFSCPELSKFKTICGNCYRVSYLSLDSRSYVNLPAISASNFVIKAKKNAVENLPKNIKNGLLIKEVVGAQDSNYYSGDFVVNIVEGYLIEDGEITTPIKPCFCSGNIYNILNDSELILGMRAEEVLIPATPLNVITPEIATKEISIQIDK
ncbi:MAG: hypothetical protein GF308_01845 [Candidatus Heimdallarchaeota archaeon]|nr:hypothetical protein [Candidatus Heimdallarchaeota archaeon]